jgi:hypothetical protein
MPRRERLGQLPADGAVSARPFLEAFVRAYLGIGRSVNFVTDVAPHARPNCRTCYGRGTVLFNHLLSPCACAGRRFMARHHTEVETQSNGDVFWKLGKEPTT